MEQDIVAFIKKEMAGRGMTYDLLAGRCGMTRQNLWLKLNKGTRPNTETIRKILNGLDYEIVIRKKENSKEIDEAAVREFFERAEEEQTVSFECIEKLLEAVGYEMQLKFQKGSGAYPRNRTGAET